MAAQHDVLIERETANDDEATIVAIHAASGAVVKPGQHLVDVETSKAVQEIEAAVGGVWAHELKVGDVIQLANPIGRITIEEPAVAKPAAETSVTEALSKSDKPAPAAAKSDLPAIARSETRTRIARLSIAAAALAKQHGLSADDLDRPLMTSADVRALIGLPVAPRAPIAVLNAAQIVAPVAPQAAPLVRRGEQVVKTSSQSAHQKPVAPHKREEIRALEAGAGSSMLSVIGITLSRPLERAHENEFFKGRITDLVVYEASRLMAKYKRLNAAFNQGAITFHDDVNAGLAIDSGGRLLVYGIKSSGKLALGEIQKEIDVSMEKYHENSFSTADLTRATFTVTDLSSLGVDFVFPLLPRGQSAILAIAKTGDGKPSLFLGFDHRVTEGLEASRFLAELKERLESYATTPAGADIRCDYCDTTLETQTKGHGNKGLLQIMDRNLKLVYCCRACWDGW